VRLNVHLVRFPWNGDAAAVRNGLIRAAQAAESVGAGGISFMDHFFGPPGRGPADDPMLEGYTALGFVAGVTQHVKLRLLVSGVTYRNPGLLAKAVATLDVLSGGRAGLGIGAAWYEREHRGLGFAFPPLAERFERVEETVRICLQMWSDDDGPFVGRHYELAETICSPRPVTSPHPQILIGGGGESRTLALVAKYADACNLFATSLSSVRRKLEVLKRHCAAKGRPFDAITKTIVYRERLLTEGSHVQFVEEMSRYASIGVDEVFVIPVGPRPEEWIERYCAPVVGALTSLESAETAR
jgi:F420-dependent oxidoreductase-like protein